MLRGARAAGRRYGALHSPALVGSAAEKELMTGLGVEVADTVAVDRHQDQARLQQRLGRRRAESPAIILLVSTNRQK